MTISRIPRCPSLISYRVVNEAATRTLKICCETIRACGEWLISWGIIPFQFLGSKFASPPEVLIRIALVFKKWIGGEPIRNLRSELFDTGYLWREESAPSREISEDALKYARLSAVAFGDNLEWIPPGCTRTHIFFDREIKMVFFQEGDGIAHVVFGPVGSRGCAEYTCKSTCDMVQNLIGLTPNLCERAEKLYLAHKSVLSGRQIQFSGQCFGGFLACGVALMQREKAFCLNAVGLGALAQWKIGRERLREATERVTHLYVKNDIVSSPCMPLVAIDGFINWVGLRTAGNFGTRYMIQSPVEYHGSPMKIHQYIAGALLRHIDPAAPVYTEETRQQMLDYLRSRDTAEVVMNPSI